MLPTLLAPPPGPPVDTSPVDVGELDAIALVVELALVDPSPVDAGAVVDGCTVVNDPVSPCVGWQARIPARARLWRRARIRARV